MNSFLPCFVLLTHFCFSQSIIVSEGSSVSIDFNSSILVDGLVFAPEIDYVITGPNSITRSNTPMVVGENSSINRVYESNVGLPNFSGTLTFSYLEGELNGIAETDLTLEILDTNGVWIPLESLVDTTNNTLSYEFTNPTAFSKVTASNVTATLTVNPLTFDGDVFVYPNPTTEVLNIVSNTTQKATLFNIAGQKLLESYAAELNVKDFPDGVYLLNLQTTQNQFSTFKIIKQ